MLDKYTHSNQVYDVFEFLFFFKMIFTFSRMCVSICPSCVTLLGDVEFKSKVPCNISSYNYLHVYRGEGLI